MYAEKLKTDTRAKLAAVSTATLTTVLFKRGFRNAVLQGVLPLNPAAPRLLGPACTMRTIRHARISTCWTPWRKERGR